MLPSLDVLASSLAGSAQRRHARLGLLDKGQGSSPFGAVAHGRFITLEGGEGAGKSTQVRRLAERLTARGHRVVATREPGGSPGAETIRELLVTGQADRWSPVTETLLMYAARRDHIERTIAPALAAGEWVVSDRFADSTRAYQGAGGGAPASLIQTLERHVLGETRPDLTLILDLPADVGMARTMNRNHAETRFEVKGAAFHERLREGFLAIARVEADRCAVIDASQTVEAVEAAIWAAVEARLAP
jgi:dTMP kinase